MTEIVREGYRRNTFDEWRKRIVGDPRDAWCDELVSRLAPGARVLELGCGLGEPKLAAFEVTGVDLVARAPGVLEADFLELDLPRGSYDACVSFYVFNHVPRERLAGLLSEIHRWLVPAGWFMHAFGTSDTHAWTGEWLGAPNFFSSFPPETNSKLVREAGFEIVRDELVTFMEPEGEATFQWVLARSI